jgi:predicted TIM-barrel fold metal-dependent hydrolase
MLTIGARKKLGLTSVFDLRFGDPLAVARLANIYPQASFIIPHFGSGMLRVTLMAMDAAPNIYVDSSSSNSWMKYQARLTLKDVFRQTIDVAGASRVLFGTDSSYFPRGWQKPIYDEQLAIINEIVPSDEDKAAILGDNARRLLGMPAAKV